MRSAWEHRWLLVLLVMTTSGGVAVFGASSARTWFEQRHQTAEEEALAYSLDARIADLDAEVKMRTSEAGARREALCVGPYVAPGTEVYAVVGLDGCVTERWNP